MQRKIHWFTNKINVEFKNLIKQPQQIQYQWQYGDKLWHFILPGETPKKWDVFVIINYQDDYYLNWNTKNFSTLKCLEGKECFIEEGRSFSFRANPNEKDWAELLKRIGRQIDRVKKDWIKVNRQVLKKVPCFLRTGVIPRVITWEMCPNFYRPDRELGRKHTEEFIQLSRSNYFKSEYNGHFKEMTLNCFLNYCRVAYLANANMTEVNESMSGLEMYKKLADGRDEGLLKIETNSSSAFKSWYESREGGGNPWEIYRGGNTTHID